MKPVSALALFLLLASFPFAASYSGDGTYNLNVSDSVSTTNNFEVTLTGINYNFTREPQLYLDLISANYSVKYLGSHVSSFTLLPGHHHTSVSGANNVTVTLDSLGNTTLTHYFATTTIASTTYVPPDISFLSINSTPGFYDATINWTTNTSTNGTVVVYNVSGGDAWQTLSDPGSAASHSVYVSGLKSYTDYYFKVTACDSTGCIRSDEQTFKTLAVIPVISGVNATNITNESAVIVWKTDVPSDSTVFYRKKGDTAWSEAPPFTYDINIIQKYIVPTEAVSHIVSPAAHRGSVASLAAYSYSVPSGPQNNAVVNTYTVNSRYINPEAINPSLVSLLVKQNHAVKLYNLDPDTVYEYFVQSCADLCANSTIADGAGYVPPSIKEVIVITGEQYLTFKTKHTLVQPFVAITPVYTDIQHGSSAVFTLEAYATSPGAHLSSTSLSWDDNGPHSLTPYYGGTFYSFVDYSLPHQAVVSVTFDTTGTHTVTLSATDTFGETANTSVDITVEANSACSATGAKYYPSDTTCTDKWPNSGGNGIGYNSGIGACHAYEVCSNDLDYMVADAESCCNAERSFSDSPSQTYYSYNKTATCQAAVDFVHGKRPLVNLDAASSMKLCKAAYLTYGIGSKAVYLKDYYTGEACCGDSDVCDSKKYPHFQAYNPWPQSNIGFSKLYCTYTHYDTLFDSWNSADTGWWKSDSDPSQNNNAMVDAPAHSSVNVMNTGTCVDYSFVEATALRKAGFAANEIMSVHAPGHLYNAVWLPGDRMYTFIDTVGNNGGDFFTGQGWSWNNNTVNHCSYDACSNDLGMRTCPAKGTEMAGC